MEMMFISLAIGVKAVTSTCFSVPGGHGWPCSSVIFIKSIKASVMGHYHTSDTTSYIL